MIEPAQIRMARGALHITVRKLAEMADVSFMTINRIENGHSSGHGATLRKIQRALEKAGVEFIDGDAPGVKLRKKR